MRGPHCGAAVVARRTGGIDALDRAGPAPSPVGLPLLARLALVLILLALLAPLATVVALPMLAPALLVVLDVASLDLLSRVCRTCLSGDAGTILVKREDRYRSCTIEKPFGRE